VWSLHTGEERTLVTCPDGLTAARALAFSPDGRLLVGGTAQESVTLWDAQSGAKRLELKGHTSIPHLATPLPETFHDHPSRIRQNLGTHFCRLCYFP
jgi:WD40 repeat protein